MMPIHKFYWNRNDEQSNYAELMEVAYNFAFSLEGNRSNNYEFYLKKGNLDDPLDYSIIYVKEKSKL